MVWRAVSLDKGQFDWLSPPKSLGAATVLDVVGAKILVDHTARVEPWARSVWQAWADHHDTIHAWIGLLET